MTQLERVNSRLAYYQQQKTKVEEFIDSNIGNSQIHEGTIIDSIRELAVLERAITLCEAWVLEAQ